MKPNNETMLAEIMSYSPEKRNEILAEKLKTWADAGNEYTAQNYFNNEASEKFILGDAPTKALQIAKDPAFSTQNKARYQMSFDNLIECLIKIEAGDQEIGFWSERGVAKRLCADFHVMNYAWLNYGKIF